jgi:twitching motility two-component system response regulator PilH
MGVRFTLVEEPRILAALLDSLREANPAEHGKPVTLELPATDAKVPVRLRTSVLIADDSLASRGMIAQQLRRHGYSVTLAKDGEEALQVAKSRQPDLILLDILMPKLSGLAVLRRLKSDATTRDIPVVVLSSLAEENDARVLAEGACGYIAKSHTSPEQLPIVVERTFEHLLATRQLQH